MSTPCESEKVKLIISLFSSQKELVDDGINKLEEFLGRTDWVSPGLYFDRTQYYAKEMGWPLHRKFTTFQKLISPEAIVDIKLATNELEKKYSQEGRRQINIDPGYISLERLVLATGKNYTHRIYLSKGIYADLTLVFNKGGFKPLDWTYRDYGDPQFIHCLNVLREKYKRQLRGLESIQS
ncbi:MAG: DUF4416 family protein [Deltaproteobacteria bacterium]|nr:DUF4416 family protein [Deltaproteobacteria bacterium]